MVKYQCYIISGTYKPAYFLIVHSMSHIKVEEREAIPVKKALKVAAKVLSMIGPKGLLALGPIYDEVKRQPDESLEGRLEKILGTR